MTHAPPRDLSINRLDSPQTPSVHRVGARRVLAAAILASFGLSACSPGDDAGRANGNSAPSVNELASRLAEEMGGLAALSSIESLVREGSGMRTRVGQLPHAGGEDWTTGLELTETIDFANGRAAFDYALSGDGFQMQRTEVYTSFEGEPIGWNTGPGRPEIATSPNGIFSWATQNSPEWLLRRNVITVALAAAQTASGDAAVEREFAGRASLYGTVRLASGEEFGLYFDPDTGLLNGYTALDTETMLGDVDAEYILDDWQPVGNVVLPHALTINKEGRPYSSMEYQTITLNDSGALSIFEVPEAAVEQARQVLAADGSWSPLTLNEVAPGVYHAVGYSHHGMVVEFPSFAVVVEAAYTEAQGETLVRMIEEQLGKPVRYAVPSHPHYDHAGALRRLVAAGATALLAAGHEQELRPILEAPHTNPADELARRRAAGEQVGGIEVFSGRHTIEEGDQRLELYEVSGIPHVEPKTLAFVPSAGALFQSDIFFGAPTPDAAALYRAIDELGLEVDVIVDGHAGVWPFAALEEAAGAAD